MSVVERVNFKPCKTCDYYESSRPEHGWPDLKFSASRCADHLLKFRVIQKVYVRTIERIEVALYANIINKVLPTTHELCWSTNLNSPPCDTEEGTKNGYYFSRFGSFATGGGLGAPDVYIWFKKTDSQKQETNEQDNFDDVELEVEILLLND
jgi:hypothetical protein